MPFDEVCYQRIEDSEDFAEAQLFERLTEADIIKLFDKFLDYMAIKYGIEADCPE